MSGVANVPWTDEEVERLNRRQGIAVLHPYTCAADGTHDSVKHSDRRILVAHPDGWWCPFDGCLYHQTWAHEGDADGTTLGIFDAPRDDSSVP
jgi:hypothetical protein